MFLSASNLPQLAQNNLDLFLGAINNVYDERFQLFLLEMRRYGGQFQDDGSIYECRFLYLKKLFETKLTETTLYDYRIFYTVSVK